MKNIQPRTQFQRNALSENIALTFALPVGLLFTLVWFIIFYSFHIPIPIIGWPSIGSATLINSGIITFIGFILGYLRGQKSLQPHERLQLKKSKLIFDCLTLATAYTIISIVLTAVAVYGISEAFKGVLLPTLSSAVAVGVLAALAAYSILSISVKIKSNDIVNALTLFIVGGVFISMATSQNPYWWQVNFSSLGTTGSASALAFNITLILSGLLLLCLTDYLLNNLEIIMQGNKSGAKFRTNAIRYLFIFISLCLMGVGLFPWNIHPFLHNFSAYSLVLGFGVLIISLKWLIPTLSKSFFANSYAILVTLLISFLLWQPFGYFNQTAFELIAFSLTFVWLILFLRTVGNMRDLSSDGSAQ